MLLIVDANVVLSTILGRRRRFDRAIHAGIELFLPEAQRDEVAKVLIRKLHVEPAHALAQVGVATWGLVVLETSILASARDDALARLGPRGQPDWPVLAAAMLLDADIWSDDRDFFGVGVPVWCRNTIEIAFAQAAA